MIDDFRLPLGLFEFVLRQHRIWTDVNRVNCVKMAVESLCRVVSSSFPSVVRSPRRHILSIDLLTGNELSHVLRLVPQTVFFASLIG